jgi:predicted dienelactone hydrolase
MAIGADQMTAGSRRWSPRGRLCRAIAGVAALLAISVSPASAAGFQTIEVQDPDGAPLEVGIWYPSRAAPSPQPLERFTQTVAPNADIDGSRLPLVLLSHDSGGSLASHYDTALALAQSGFVVAAVTHAGDSNKDQSKSTDVTERPRQLHIVLDYLLGGWAHHDRLDAAHVGAFGFAAGGFAALVLIGGEPDMASIGPYCGAFQRDWLCRTMRERHIDLAAFQPHAAWVHDSRIKAAVIAAPALGFTFSTSLAGVFVPSQLWRAARDEILPQPNYAQAVYDGLLVKPDYHVVANASHFAFLPPCPDALANTAPDICQNDSNFDRAAFHDEFNAAVVKFFASRLQLRDNGAIQQPFEEPR